MRPAASAGASARLGAGGVGAAAGVRTTSLRGPVLAGGAVRAPGGTGPAASLSRFFADALGGIQDSAGRGHTRSAPPNKWRPLQAAIPRRFRIYGLVSVCGNWRWKHHFRALV